MPHYILKIKTAAGPRYLDWSTITDAPASSALTRAGLKQHWLCTYGRDACGDLDDRLRDADRYGTDDLDRRSVAQVIAGNRAGPRETTATLAQIVDWSTARTRSRGR